MKRSDEGRLERDDSRGLDDELSPPEAARVSGERTADPARARGVARLREALDLWVEDARLAGEAADPERRARRVLARIAADPDGAAFAAPRASWSYVAAAAALLAVGVGGLWASWPRRAAPRLPGVTFELEQDSLAMLRRVEIEGFRVEGR